MTRNKKRWLAAGLFLVLLLGLSWAASLWLRPGEDVWLEEFSVRFLDVGQGDCALIAANGHLALVDAGTRGSAGDTLAALEELGVQKLDLALVTHGHADHMGGMAPILAAYPADLLVLPPEENERYEWLEMLVQAEESRTEIAEVSAGWEYDLGGARLQLLFPTEEERAAADNLNDTSLVLRVEYGDYSFFLGGDCEAAAEQRLLEREKPAPVTVFKANHHGSGGSNTEALLEALNPEYCVISCGMGNEYGHPHDRVLELLDRLEVKTYRTDRDGTVRFRLEGGRLTVSPAA